MLRDDSPTTSGLLTRNCGSLIAIAHAPDVPKRASWKIVIRMQSLGRSPLGTAATHHNDVTTRSSIPIHFQQQISTELPDNPWLRHYYYYYLISLSFVPSLPYSFRPRAAIELMVRIPNCGGDKTQVPNTNHNRKKSRYWLIDWEYESTHTRIHARDCQGRRAFRLSKEFNTINRR
ncbi:hypothetical protein AFLA_011023 [Aspergillus flavus NRRL3357]|nr:hypothetical protein AFLA_011023 [Aspergillus flavus NRRL3357]